ncbi:hypothetical protein BACCIP111895_04216 [Neobacillus rhizosphaerae]|uniref:DUF4383 domain-containing protein n=1 Tax=Neobacillus rhizosphaerae TaxID=2880965 RepID=A0ABM9EWH7_9BACI|nr:hypothetical protein [Neobacillus rhizosphaerae]CAH2717027.1 hypothetical protein BACCIP111895_04216 [Neobacillus rhizosphaerae]
MKERKVAPLVSAKIYKSNRRKMEKVNKVNKLKVLSYCTGTLLAFVGVGAVSAGWGLIMEPSGKALGLPLDFLGNSPFADYLIPGIALFSINGIASLIGAFLAFRTHRFIGMTTLVLGIAMIIWISVQVYWIGWQSWLQPTFLGVGLVEISLGFLFIDQYIDQGLFKHRHGHHVH